MEIKPRFTIRANFFDHDYGNDIKYRDDIISWTIQRCPLARTASSSILIMNMINEEAQLMKNMIYTQTYPKVDIDLYLIDETKAKTKLGRSNREKHQAIPDSALKHHFYSHRFIVVGIQLLESDKDKNYVRCLLVLANPIFVFLNNTNSFSKHLKLGKTSLEILNDFENYLETNFGNVFWKHKVVDSSFENHYRLEQLLPRIENDLLVPNMLLYKYKAYNSFGFYFFDDFCIDQQSTGPIALHYINLARHEVFQKYDLKDEQNIKAWYGMTIKRQSVVYDVLNRMTNMFKLYGDKNYKPPQNLVIYNYTMDKVQKHDIGKDFIPVAHGSTSISNTFPYSELNVDVKEVEEQFTYKIIYAPDSFKTAFKRYQICSKQIEDYLNQVIEYKFTECFPHIFNFGYTYNLTNDEASGDDYFITPISIVNHFYRVSGPMPILSHEARLQTIQMFIEGAHNSMSGITTNNTNATTSVVDDSINPRPTTQNTLTPTERSRLVSWVMKNGGRSHLTKEQAEQIVDAAYRTKYPDLILATAFKESSFNPKAISKNTKYGRSYGLTQINWQIWGPYLRKKGIANSKEDLFNPVTAVKASEAVIDEMHRTNKKYDGTLKGHVAAYYGKFNKYYYDVVKGKLREIHTLLG